MTETGLDIHEEILVRLQVNDLIRYKRVCKSWNSLISSPRFAKSQLNCSLKKKADNNETGNTRIYSLAATGLCNDREYLVGSSNGLVCISRKATDFLVVNPSTLEVKQLRNPCGEFKSGSACVSGFGYDSSIDDYKVVIGFFNDWIHKISFKVLTLKSKVWRSVAVESGYDNLWGKGILCNGAIHWYTSRNNKRVIVSFDLSKEVFKEIPQPKLRQSDWYLGTMKDCLCIVARPYQNFRKNKDIQIWVMRSYNVQESWERTLPPPGYDTRKPMMSYVLPEDFFSCHVHIWLLEEGSGAPVLVRSIKRRLCELRSGLHRGLFHNDPHIRLCTNSECDYNYDDHVYVKSLVSPHGMGNHDKGDDNINDGISLSTLFSET